MTHRRKSKVIFFSVYNSIIPRQKIVIWTLTHDIAGMTTYTIPCFCQWNKLPLCHIINFPAALLIYKILIPICYFNNDFHLRNIPMNYISSKKYWISYSFNSSTKVYLLVIYRYAEAWILVREDAIWPCSCIELDIFKRNVKWTLNKCKQKFLKGGSVPLLYSLCRLSLIIINITF